MGEEIYIDKIMDHKIITTNPAGLPVYATKSGIEERFLRQL
jgi:hypothetical protein